jgi:heptosyltransferase-2
MGERPPKPKTFLIIQTAFTGDAILATALIEKIASTIPGAEIDLVVRKGNEGLFTGHPYLRSLFVWDKRGGGKYRSLVDIIRKARANRYDICCNLQRYTTTAILALLSRARMVVGFSGSPLALWYTRSIARRMDAAAGLTHEVDLYLRLLEGVVPDTGRVLPRLYPSREDVDSVRRTGPYVTIAPASVWFTKQYPAGRWSEVIGRISRDLTVLLIGGPADREICENIRAGAPRDNVENMAGAHTFLQSAALMKHAVMNYVNDSAPLHIATAMGAPVTAVFCSTIPAFGFGPLGPNGRVVETDEPLGCRPCGIHGKRSCPEGHFRCADIAADRIVT